MSEKLIETVTTQADFQRTLAGMGVKPTDAILVHSAMSKFYFIPGGPEAIVNALEKTVKDGTLMMPSEVSTNSDPAEWMYPPVREDLIQKVRDNMPPYNPQTTPSYIGTVAEYFRTRPDVKRSGHPHIPISIWGKNAKEIAQRQPMDVPYGVDSPLDYLYQHDGKTVFLGTDYETCTIFHYAESTIGRPTEICSAPTGVEDGKTIWTKYQNIDMDSYDDFSELGAAFEKACPDGWKQQRLNNGLIKVINIRPLIDFARKWFQRKDQEVNNQKITLKNKIAMIIS